MFILTLLLYGGILASVALILFLLWALINSVIILVKSHKNYPVTMSFNQFRRIYELNPNKWYVYSEDGCCERKEWLKLESGKCVEKTVTISMKTLFDLWRLLLWNWMDDIKVEKEINAKKGMNELKALSEMINKDAEEIQRQTQREMKKLMKQMKK